MVVVLAFTSAAMVASMHSRMTPENVAAAAMQRMTSGLSGGKSASTAGFGEHLFLLGDPETSWWSKMAESMHINYSPLLTKISQKLTSSADVFRDMAADLAQEDSSVEQPDVITKMITEMLPNVAADVSAALRTGGSAVKMMSTYMDPPSEEVEPEHYASHQSLLSYFMGTNLMRDEDGSATFPLAIWLQKMVDTSEMKQLVDACVDSMSRVHSHMAMTIYTPVPLNPFTHQCLEPTSDPEENPMAAIADSIGTSTRKACEVDPKVSTLCMCEEDKLISDVADTTKIVLDVCRKLQASMAKKASP